MGEWTPGMACRVVEHDEAARKPKPGGRVIPARVIGAAGAYVKVRHLAGDWEGKFDVFWSPSGWRAWDGNLRWRLLPGTGEGAATAAGSEES